MLKAYAITTGDNDAKRDCEIVFIPGAVRVQNAYTGGGYATFGNSKDYPANRNDLIDKINKMPSSLNLFAYFGHGYNTQLGGHILTEADINMLADALQPKMNSGGSVVSTLAWPARPAD